MPAQPVTIVDQGKLENYLVGPRAGEGFSGVERPWPRGAGTGCALACGCAVVKPSAPVPAAEMQAKLLAMAKEQGRDVYEVETLGGELAPRMLYRVSAGWQADAGARRGVR